METAHEHVHIEHCEDTVSPPPVAPPLPKNRASRRAHGQRGTARTGRDVRGADRKPTGAQRAALRAHAKGLRIGNPVRAEIGRGVGHRSAAPHPAWVPYGERVYVGPQGAPPLEFGERITNYQVQASVRGHTLVGTRWRPTPKQRRRLDHKARHAQAPFKRPSAHYRKAAAEGLAALQPAKATAVETGWHKVSGTVELAPRTPMVEQRAGFRVVDRRREHA